MDALNSLHVLMLAALDEIERLCLAPRCEEEAVMAVRYRLTRLSTARRQCVTSLCERAIAEGRGDPSIVALRDATRRSRAESSHHIGTWTLRRVSSDWTGYCRASTALRSKLRQEIAQERAILAGEADGIHSGAAADPASRPPSMLNSAPVT